MEIEIRAKINSINDVEKNIIKLGAELIKKTTQVDEYFGEISLYQKIGYSFLMRVRNEGDKKFMTYKGAQSKKDGVWEEYEFKIDEVKKTVEMFKAMGLEEVIVVKKYRKEYVLDGLTICLDAIDDLGNFIEIESLDDKNINKNSLKSLMRKLSIKENEILHKGYVTMLLIKNNSPYSRYIVN